MNLIKTTFVHYKYTLLHRNLLDHSTLGLSQKCFYLPAAPNRAQCYGVSHNCNQGLGSGDGRVEQLVIGEKAIVQVLG